MRGVSRGEAHPRLLHLVVGPLAAAAEQVQVPLARVLGHVDRPPVLRRAIKVAPGRLADVQEVGAQPADGKLREI